MKINRKQLRKLLLKEMINMMPLLFASTSTGCSPGQFDKLDYRHFVIFNVKNSKGITVPDSTLGYTIYQQVYKDSSGNIVDDMTYRYHWDASEFKDAPGSERYFDEEYSCMRAGAALGENVSWDNIHEILKRYEEGEDDALSNARAFDASLLAKCKSSGYDIIFSETSEGSILHDNINDTLYSDPDRIISKLEDAGHGTCTYEEIELGPGGGGI